jgi:hypothetical protein
MMLESGDNDRADRLELTEGSANAVQRINECIQQLHFLQSDTIQASVQTGQVDNASDGRIE